MEVNRAIEIVRSRLEEIDALSGRDDEDPSFVKWHRITQVALRKIFGQESEQVTAFDRIHFYLTVSYDGTTDDERKEVYERGLRHAAAFLESILSELQTYGEDENREDAVTRLLHVIDRFNLVARQVRDRYAGRPTLDVEDEYDVQDLMHALLGVDFDDIRKEEWCPSYAGGASRMDFLLKNEQVVLETKKSRKGLDAKRLGEELLIDIQRYQAHPDCKRLVCFVYDPEARIANPRGIENDLTGNRSGIDVIVRIAPSGR